MHYSRLDGTYDELIGYAMLFTDFADKLLRQDARYEVLATVPMPKKERELLLSLGDFESLSDLAKAILERGQNGKSSLH